MFMLSHKYLHTQSNNNIYTGSDKWWSTEIPSNFQIVIAKVLTYVLTSTDPRKYSSVEDVLMDFECACTCSTSACGRKIIRGLRKWQWQKSKENPTFNWNVGDKTLLISQKLKTLFEIKCLPTPPSRLSQPEMKNRRSLIPSMLVFDSNCSLTFV